jgi:hypothetical protein
MKFKNILFIVMIFIFIIFFPMIKAGNFEIRLNNSITINTNDKST